MNGQRTQFVRSLCGLGRIRARPRTRRIAAAHLIDSGPAVTADTMALQTKPDLWTDPGNRVSNSAVCARDTVVSSGHRLIRTLNLRLVSDR